MGAGDAEDVRLFGEVQKGRRVEIIGVRRCDVLEGGSRVFSGTRELAQRCKLYLGASYGRRILPRKCPFVLRRVNAKRDEGPLPQARARRAWRASIRRFLPAVSSETISPGNINVMNCADALTIFPVSHERPYKAGYSKNDQKAGDDRLAKPSRSTFSNEATSRQQG